MIIHFSNQLLTPCSIWLNAFCMFNLVKCFLYDIRFVIVINLYSTRTLLKSELVCWNLNELGGGKCYAPGSCPNMCITNLMFPFFFTETFLPRKQVFCLVMRFYVHRFVMNISYLDQHDKSVFIIINTHLLT